MIFRSLFLTLRFHYCKLLSLLIVVANSNISTATADEDKSYKKVYIDSNATSTDVASNMNHILGKSVEKTNMTPKPDASDKSTLAQEKPSSVSKTDLSIPMPPSPDASDKSTLAQEKPSSVSKTDLSIPIPPSPDASDKSTLAQEKPSSVSKTDLSIPIPPSPDASDKSTLAQEKPLLPSKETDKTTTEIKNKKFEAAQKTLKESKHKQISKHEDEPVEEEIMIEEIILDTELYSRPVYEHKNIVLPPSISKKQYSEKNRHLPKVFYQSEYTSLLFDAVKGDDVQGIKSLIQKGANINAQEISTGYTLVMNAIRYNKIKALRVLILNGADLQKTNLQGQTALHIAAHSGNAQAIEILLSAGIDPTVKDKKGNRASEYMKSAVQNIAMIMAANYQDMNKALIDFVGLGAFDAVLYALQNGAKIDFKDDVSSDGDTPLMIAIKCQDIKMISLLLNHGARIDIRNNRKKNVIDIANDVRNNEIISIIKTVQINRDIEKSM